MSNKKEEVNESGMDTQIPASNMLDFLSIIIKYRKFISRFIILCTIGTLIVTFLLPKWYKSTASVLPAERADLMGGLEGIASLTKSLSAAKGLASLGSNPEIDRYQAILKSGRVSSAVIQKFDLVNVYGITSYPGENTLEELMNNVTFTVEDEGNLTVTVYDTDPQRAADMANFFVEMLNKTNTELQVQNARDNRKFIEERYKKNLIDLSAAEDSLKVFQKKYGIIAMPEQIGASIKAAAEITGQIAVKEVQVNVLRRTQSVDNPSVIATQIEIDELRNKLTQMNNGVNVGKKEINIFVPFRKVPDLGSEYVRRFREVEIQYKILQFLTPLYEQAKVEENRQTLSVLVLDKASPAERKSKPKILLYTLFSFIISTIAAFFTVFLIVGIQRLQVLHSEPFYAFKNAILSDWHSFRSMHKKK